MQKLLDLFSKPPAGLVWSQSADGQRWVGTSEGFVLDIWPDKVIATCLMPPDRADLAARNGTLLQLLLVALRPDWQTASTWLAQQMRLAACFKQPRYDTTNITRGVGFVWDRQHSRATLTVKVDEP